MRLNENDAAQRLPRAGGGNARLYPINDLATETGMMSGTMVIDATGASVKRQNVSAAGYGVEPVTAGTT